MTANRKQTLIGNHAVVLGGSMAGLLAARVLSDHFAQVTLVERDRISDAGGPRKGVPQGRHAHAVLARGLNIMNDLFPGLRQDLVQDGALAVDMGANFIWHQFGGYKIRFPSEFIGVTLSRPFLETHVRERVMAIPNVRLIEETDFRGLATTVDRSEVTGVQIRRRGSEVEETLVSDLVVDATGRGSSTPRWLENTGYGRPAESVVKMDVGYATRLYHRWSDDPHGGNVIIVQPELPDSQRLGAAIPIEGDRWIVTLCGWGGDHPPTDEQGFLDYARSLAAPDIYDLISRSEPLGDIVVHKLPSNLRRHYEKMSRFPEGLIVMGDAVASFNPVYGQGMTTASMQALALQEILEAQQADLAGLPKRFFQRAAKVIAIPWSMAAGEDFRFPKTEGHKAPGTDLLNRYMVYVHKAAQSDEQVQRCFLMAMNMIAPPTIMFRPSIVWRVIKAAIAGRGTDPTGEVPSLRQASTTTA